MQLVLRRFVFCRSGETHRFSHRMSCGSGAKATFQLNICGGNTRQKQCLSRESSGNTRQRQCLTWSFSIPAEVTCGTASKGMSLWRSCSGRQGLEGIHLSLGELELGRLVLVRTEHRGVEDQRQRLAPVLDKKGTVLEQESSPFPCGAAVFAVLPVVLDELRGVIHRVEREEGHPGPEPPMSPQLHLQPLELLHTPPRLHQPALAAATVPAAFSLPQPVPRVLKVPLTLDQIPEVQRNVRPCSTARQGTVLAKKGGETHKRKAVFMSYL